MKKLWLVISLILTSACSPELDEAAVQANSADNVAIATEPRLTKSQVRERVVRGMTQAEVRAALGQPSNVIEQTYDGVVHWFWWKQDLPVLDEDAGVEVSSTAVTFSVSTGRVIEVRF